MSLDNKSKARSHGGKEGSLSDSSKFQKRDYSLVSPPSPQSPVTLANIRLLFKEEIEPIKKEIDQLKKSVGFNSEQLKVVTSLCGKIAQLEKDNCEITGQLKESPTKCSDLQEKVIALETYSRKNNLKFSQLRGTSQGFHGLSQQDCESLILNLFAKIGLNINSSEIECAHWIGYHKLVNRPIIVRFLNYKVRQIVYREKIRFKDIGVVVTEDFPKEVMVRRKVFQPVLQAAFQSSGKYKAHLNMDKLILNGKSYSTDDLEKLPNELEPSNLCNIAKDGKLAFFTHHSKLSNHHQCFFKQSGYSFSSVEQFYTFKKAKHFEDDDTAGLILNNNNPVEAMRLANRTKNFNSEKWKQVCVDYMRQGLQQKFNQNPSLASYLKGTDKLLLVEANPFDNFWGAGVGLNNSDIWDETRWKGRNELGSYLWSCVRPCNRHSSLN